MKYFYPENVCKKSPAYTNYSTCRTRKMPCLPLADGTKVYIKKLVSNMNVDNAEYWVLVKNERTSSNELCNASAINITINGCACEWYIFDG